MDERDDTLHLVTNELPVTNGPPTNTRACHPCYPTLTYQLAATRLHEMGVDVPGDGWITDVFLEDVVGAVDRLRANTVDRGIYDGTVELNNKYDRMLSNTYVATEITIANLKNLLGKIEDGEHYGEGFDLEAELTVIIHAVSKMRDGMDR